MNESEVSKVTSEKPATAKKDVVVKTEKPATPKKEVVVKTEKQPTVKNDVLYTVKVAKLLLKNDKWALGGSDVTASQLTDDPKKLIKDGFIEVSKSKK